MPARRYTSYVVTLLPGLIGMTLLIIGLNGLGSVLIEEEHHGLHKNRNIEWWGEANVTESISEGPGAIYHR